MYTVYLANLNKKKKKMFFVGVGVPSQAELNCPRGSGRTRLPGSALIHEIVQDNTSGWSHAAMRFGRQLMWWPNINPILDLFVCWIFDILLQITIYVGLGLVEMAISPNWNLRYIVTCRSKPYFLFWLWILCGVWCYAMRWYGAVFCGAVGGVAQCQHAALSVVDTHW